MRAAGRARVLIALSAAACADQPDHAPEPTQPAERTPRPRTDRATAPTSALDLVARYECNRCHDGTGLADAPRDRHCVHCHRDIHDGVFPADADAIAEWREHIVSLRHVPSLASAARLRRRWVEAQLLAPRDVRPALAATMPRLAISSADAERLAAQLVPVELPPVAFDPADAARGRALFGELGCASCHRFSGQALGPAPDFAAPGGRQTPSGDAIALAPDLALTRDRVQPGRLVEWLRAPDEMSPGTRMPTFQLSGADAQSLAAFVMTAPVAAPAQSDSPRRLPVLTRAVRFDEVAARVFRKVCWHCHASADLARGDGGPGNTGGFGFTGRGLDLSTHEGVLAGARGDDRRRHSVLAPGPDGTPRIVAHMIARHVEVAGREVPGVRGMPLGLPPIPLGDIQLVDSWIAQGRRE